MTPATNGTFMRRLALANCGIGIAAITLGFWLSLRTGGLPPTLLNTPSVLLGFAEILKLASAVLLGIVVRLRGEDLVLGFGAVGLTGAAGVVGLFAITAGNAQAGSLVTPLALGGLIAAGLWAFGSSTALAAANAKAARALALLWIVGALGGLFIPPVALIAGIASILWWLSVAVANR